MSTPTPTTCEGIDAFANPLPGVRERRHCHCRELYRALVTNHACALDLLHIAEARATRLAGALRALVEIQSSEDEPSQQHFVAVLQQARAALAETLGDVLSQGDV